MTNFVDRLPEGHVRDWYQEHTHPIIRNDLAASLISQGYRLDPQSGLFLRPLFERHLPYTLLDIAFMRPTDSHYHEDVIETIRVIGGRGMMINDIDGPNEKREELQKGWEGVAFKMQTHAFRPNKNTYLELRIACDGILDPAKEVCVQRFDQVPKWIEYFSSTRNE